MSLRYILTYFKQLLNNIIVNFVIFREHILYFFLYTYISLSPIRIFLEGVYLKLSGKMTLRWLDHKLQPSGTILLIPTQALSQNLTTPG